MSNDKLREEFEVAFVSEQVLRFGEGYRDSAIHMLKRSGDLGFERAPTQYELNRRKGGLYDMHWIEMVWWAWQASREALVIEWPDQHTYTVPDVAGAAILDCRTAYSKALGLKVKP